MAEINTAVHNLSICHRPSIRVARFPSFGFNSELSWCSDRVIC